MAVDATPAGRPARTIYASQVAGVTAGLDLDTGRIAGASVSLAVGQANAAAINPLLTPGTHLVFDSGFPWAGPLLVGPGVSVTDGGRGHWDRGLYMLDGANSSAIQNFPSTNLAAYNAWQPPTRPQAIAGKDLTIAGIRINCNRAGNCTGATDGTLTGQSATAGDPRGPYAGVYWLSGLALLGLDNVFLDHVWVYDAPTYHINLYHCTNVTVRDSRVESGNPAAAGNTDGIHVNGGCSSVRLLDNWLATGDDAIALNLDEGDGSAGSDFLISGNTFANCHAGVRVYGTAARTRRVRINDSSAYGIWDRFLDLGNESVGAGSTRDVSASVAVDGLDFASNGARALAWVNGNVASLDMRGVRVVEPTSATPVVLMANGSVVSTMKLEALIHRNHNGSAAVPLLSGSSGQIGDLDIDVRVTEEAGANYTDIAKLIDTANLTVGQARIRANVAGVGTLIDIPSTATVGGVVLSDIVHVANTGSNTAKTVVSAAGSAVPVSVGRYSGSNLGGIASGAVALTGPGILPSGLPVADALMGNASLYLGSDHGGVPCVKVAGTAKTINLT